MLRGMVAKIGRVLQVEAQSLLVKKTAGAGCAGGVGFTTQIMPLVIQAQEAEFFATHMDNGPNTWI